MLLTIDGKQVPTNPSPLRMRSMYDTTMAMFILQNLKPDSVIGWMDLEGLGQPTYDGLMMYAQAALPFYRFYSVTRYIGTLEMRLACAKLCNRVDHPKSEYITHEILQAINDERSRKSKQQVAEAYYKSQGKGYMIIDSIPQTNYAGKIVDGKTNGVEMEFGRFRGLNLHTRHMLDGLVLSPKI